MLDNACLLGRGRLWLPETEASTARRFVHSALQGNHITVLSEFEWFKAGLELYGSRADKSWSLTDCISFSVMEARGIREALTGDQHFEQAGFVRLLVAGH